MITIDPGTIDKNQIVLDVIRTHIDENSKCEITLDSKLFELGIKDDLDFISLLSEVELEFEFHGFEFFGDADALFDSCLNIFYNVQATVKNQKLRFVILLPAWSSVENSMYDIINLTTNHLHGKYYDYKQFTHM